MEAEKYWYYYTSYLIMLQEFSRVHNFQCPNASHNPTIMKQSLVTQNPEYSVISRNRLWRGKPAKTVVFVDNEIDRAYGFCGRSEE